jgi:hypothetical protein
VAGVDTLDAITERAGTKKPEGRACAISPLTFSAAATAAGANLTLAISLTWWTKCDQSEGYDSAELTRSKKKAFLNSCCNAVGITLGIKDAFGAAGLIFAAVAGGSLLRRERQVPLKRRIRVAVVDRTANPAELEVSTLRPRRLSLPRMSITRELRDRLSRPLSILFARSAIDIRLCFARGAIFVHRKQQRSGHIHTLGSTVTARGTVV